MSIATTHALMLVPQVLDLRGEAANDGPSREALASEWTDVNLLVATTVAQVSARLRPVHVNVALDLDASDPLVAGDATALGFALSGTLGALIRTAEDAGGEQDLKVCVTAHGRQVCVAMVGVELPSIEMLRALLGHTDARLCDPTLAHCRRLVLAQGGTLVLEQRGDEIALALRLPVAPASKGTRVSGSLRKPAPWATGPAVLALAA